VIEIALGRPPRLLLLMVSLSNHGCANLGNDPEPLLMTRTGEHPTVCYARAKHFAGLVPISCDEAELVKP
jgi:hypothetical protein